MSRLGVLKPLRGTDSSLANVVLDEGEIAFSYPESGPGTGVGGIKMGNGTDTFSNLDWYVNGSNGIGNDVITDTSESTNTAAYVHEVGNYFMNRNEKLCKTTKKINIGDTISVGTGENDNCVLVSVGEELSLLNSKVRRLHLGMTITRQFTNGFYHATRSDLDNVNYLIEMPWFPFVSTPNERVIIAGGRYDADGFNLRIVNDLTYTGALDFQIWGYVQPR